MLDVQLTRALLPDGWASDVRVRVDDHGVITSVEPGTARESESHQGSRVCLDGPVVPGMPDVHSHAFQRGLVGRTERRGTEENSFWGWRDVMYRFVDRLDPDDIETITTLAQVEMLEAGFTSVGEFHYLHHDVGGSPYDDPGETSGRICRAAAATGIGLTLLPVLYRHGGFGPTEPGDAQRRFVSDPDLFARIVSSAADHLTGVPGAILGLAPHSLRAVTSAEITDVLTLAEAGPVHIHVAEQTVEVEAALRHLGARPVAHLLDTQPVDSRWCLIHATHMDPSEIRRAASTGAVAGLCPVTEANLGDGLFPAVEWRTAGGTFGVGTDGNTRIDVAGELRTLEYGRRLTERRRNVLADPGASTGRTLFEAALNGGSRALGRPRAGIAVGAVADFVMLESSHPVMSGLEDDDLLDAWIFGGDARVVREVWAAGRRVVVGGRAVAREHAETAWRETARRLAG